MSLFQLFEKKAASNISIITTKLLQNLNVPVSASVAIETIEQHPDYPSLLSISEALNDWKIENLALQVDDDKLSELPVPFIAHVKKNGGGSFVLVNSVNGAVNYVDERGKRRSKPEKEFVKNWNGTVLLVEATNQSGQKDYLSSRKKEVLDGLRIPFIIGSSIALSFLYMTTHSVNLVWNILFQVIKLTGVVVTALLLLYELDQFTPLLKQICHASKTVNCNAVLGSKHAKLFNWIGWGEIGFFYFTGGFLFLLLGQSSQLILLSWLNLFALPYTIFSVLYQWRVVKQWCPLCLTVQALLITEGVLCYFNYWKVYEPLKFSFDDVIPFLVSFLLPVFFWMATKKVYLAAQDGNRNKKELSKLKYNKEIFHALLLKQKQITASSEGLGITLGNPNASNTIIKVCNPYCGPCARAHVVIDEILENNDDVKVQIIFTATNDKDDIRAEPVKHLMALYSKKDEALIRKALDDWYLADKKDYDAFAAKYLLNGELKLQSEKLEAMDKWYKATDISFTPTFFVNGYQLPEIYKIEDLKHLL